MSKIAKRATTAPFYVIGFAALATIVVLFFPAAAFGQTKLVGPDSRPWMNSCLKKSRLASPNLTLKVYRSLDPPRSYIAPWQGKIWLSDFTNSTAACYVLRHEIGHLFDYTVLNSLDRNYVACQIMGEKGSLLWWSRYEGSQFIPGGEGRDSVLERFAEFYAVAATFSGTGRSSTLPASIVLHYGAHGRLIGDNGKFRHLLLKNFAKYIKDLNKKTIPSIALRDQRIALPAC